MTIDFCCVDSCVQYTVRGPVKPLKPKKLMYADCCAKDETTAMKTMHSIPCFSDTTRLITAVWILKISLKTQKNPKSELAFSLAGVPVRREAGGVWGGAPRKPWSVEETRG